MARIVGFAGGAAISLEQSGESPVAPTITTTSLLNGRVGSVYNRTVYATGDTPFTWDITVGDLPDGLSLNAGTGAISGTPTTEETQAFTIRATNDAGNDTQALSITIGPASTGNGGGTLILWRRRGRR